MDANRAIAPSIVLEFKQSALRAMGPLEPEALAALRDLGFRFCMDQVTDLRMEPRDLGERGIRYVKVPAIPARRRRRAGSDIHAADLSDLLGRFGISLIAERIEAEARSSTCSTTTCASARASCSRRRARCGRRRCRESPNAAEHARNADTARRRRSRAAASRRGVPWP